MKKSGWGILSIVRLMTIRWRFVTRDHTIWSMPGCGWSTKMAFDIRKVKRMHKGESCTYEFWVPDGSALVYVSYLKGQQGRSICRLIHKPASMRRYMQGCHPVHI